MKPKRCLDCGGPMKRTIHALYHYTESGLPNVYLQDIEALICTKCGAEDVLIPDLEGLHGTLFAAILFVGRDLIGKEFAFVRRQLGIKAKDFAHMLGYIPETLSEVENDRYGADLKKIDLAVRNLAVRLVYTDDAHRDLRPALQREVDAFQKRISAGTSQVEIGPPAKRYTLRHAQPEPTYTWVEGEAFLAA
jgi:hypothetical protein